MQVLAFVPISMLINVDMTRRLFLDDAVFLDDEREREECVMTEIGIIYHGAYDDISERNWNYGQVRDKDEQGFPSFIYKRNFPN